MVGSMTDGSTVYVVPTVNSWFVGGRRREFRRPRSVRGIRPGLRRAVDVVRPGSGRTLPGGPTPAVSRSHGTGRSVVDAKVSRRPGAWWLEEAFGGH
jgi:hypothetical protein